MTADTIWQDVATIRSEAPLVHNITNYVVMNNTANALLALGASPVMAHAPQEVVEMVGIAASLVVNIGTLSAPWIEAMGLAMQTAAARGIPIVFDPVGAGATSYRSACCRELLHATAPTVIRGNASEIMALVDATVRTKGVDSSASETAAAGAALELARHYGCVVVVSGAVDLVTDGTRQLLVDNGHPLMPKVTGLGCTASALVGAFAAVNPAPLAAAAHAMAVMGICGELAAEQAAGPGTLQVHFIDALYNLSAGQISSTLRLAPGL